MLSFDASRWPELVWPNRTYERGAGVALPVIY